MTRPLIELDLECYPTYFLAKFYDERTGRFASFGMWEGQPLDVQAIVNILARVTIVTFNGNNYDLLMLVLALHGATNAQLKEANDDIIERKMAPWTFRDKWGVVVPDYIDHIDVAEVAPGVRISLKMYMGRMHAPKMQDLPYDPNWNVGPIERFVIADYCGNDLIGTNLLRRELSERIALRIAIGERYGVDVRSKSDAQIAEAVIKSQLAFEPQKRYVADGFSFLYEPPAYIQYVTPEMRDLLEVVKQARFVVRDKEEAIIMGGFDPDDPEAPKIKTGVRIPKELSGRDIVIGHSTYRLGIGGLHSQESCVTHHTVPGRYKLRDIDVKSYYPSLILTMGMVPQQLGDAFLIIYRAIYERRLLSKSEASRIADLWESMGAPELKEEADRLRTESDGLKIVLNGTFGKLFSKWSVLFAPELGIRVTITGQLALLMLIEMMECSGIRVISANTDGIVLLIPEGMDAVADQVIAWWERRTGLEMESTYYRSLYQRDVNAYVAITTEGKAKRNGVFRPGGVLSGPQGKGPNMDICADAVVAFFKDGTPLHKTIMECKDIRKFIVIRNVKGGGYYLPDGQMTSPERVTYLGKAVRWYYSTNRDGYLAYKDGKLVASSTGGTPCMELPSEFPLDIDFDKYIAKAWELVADVGVAVRYWWHEESESAFITLADGDFTDLFANDCIEVDKKFYKKRKA